jgi:tetratricopeptide (TPR) repeat protein
VIVVLFITSFIIPTTSFADEPLKVGKAALEKGDLPTAISAFREAVKKDKKDPEGYLLLGTALLKADSAGTAEAALIQARELNPNNAAIYEMLGDVYVKQKLYPAAVDPYKKATELDSTKMELFIKLADAYKKTRKYTEAANAYGKVLGFDSTNVSALTEISTLFFKGKQFANAKVILTRLYRLKPDDPAVQVQYGKSLFETKDCEPLKLVAQKIHQRDPNNAEAEGWLAWAQVCTGDFKLAEDFYNKANWDSMTAKQLIEGYTVYKNLGQFEKAAKILEMAYHKDSVNCWIPYELGSTYLKIKRWSDAVAMFDKKISCDTSAGFRFASSLNAGMALLQLKKFKEAKEYILKSIEYRPDNVQAWQILAQDYGLLDQIEDEISAYKKVIDLATPANTNGEEGKYNSQLEEAYRAIGIQLLIGATKDKDPKTNKEKYIRAAEYIKKVLQYDPKDCDALYYVGVAGQNSNNKEEAKKYYRKFLDSCPNDKRVEEVKKHLESLGE